MSSIDNASRARDNVSAVAQVQDQTPGFHYCLDKDAGSYGHRLEIQRDSGISAQDKGALRVHYGTSDIFERQSQHSIVHSEYIKSAAANDRKPTRHESGLVERVPGREGHRRWTGRREQVIKGNIAHIISNSMAQTQLNRMTAQFLRGRGTVIAALPNVDPRSDDGLSASSAGKQVIAGLAAQAAAVARMRGLGRAILAEEQPDEGYGRAIGANATHEGKRNLMAEDISVAFGNTASSTATDRETAYWRYLEHTVDSHGNTRVGNIAGNSTIRSSFDPELTEQSVPTPRSTRLYKAIDYFGMADLATGQTRRISGTEFDLGYFATDRMGRILASSKEADTQPRAADDTEKA